MHGWARKLTGQALLTCLFVPLVAAGQGYPAKPVRIVVPLAAGGGVDSVARAFAQKYSEAWKLPVIVENRPGAGNIIGADYVAKAAPDGYTLLASSSSLASNAVLFRKLPFDAVRDFAPVTQFIATQLFLALNQKVPASNVRELIAYAKSQPGKLNYGSTGIGSGAHLISEMLKMDTGIDVVHVPYKGLAPALTDVMSGQLGFTFGSQLALEGPLKLGRLRAIASTGKTRLRTAADVPTIAESGYGDYSMTAWWGVAVAAHTPRGVVNRLRDDIVAVLEQSDVRERLSGQGIELAGTTPAEFERFVREEVERWGQAVRQSGAKPD